MSENIPPSNAKRVFLRDMIIEHIRELITSRQLLNGNRLPPERELASRFSVSRHSVREAIRMLEQQGCLQTHIGSGTYVLEAESSNLSQVFTQEALRERSNLFELLEFRRTVEPRIAFLAAMNVTPEGGAALLANVAKLRESVIAGDIEEWNRIDVEFHVQLAQMTGNSLFAQTGALLNQAMVVFRNSGGSLKPRMRASLAAHEKIAQAVANGDPKRAASAMERHIILTVCKALSALSKM